MTTLAVDVPRVFEFGDINEMPVIASDIIYEGAAVGNNGSGYARPLVAGDPFKGFAESKADNSTGSAGDVRVRLISEGYIVLNISGLAITDLGKPVYASDDDTFTLTATNNSYVGRVHRFVSTGVGVVAFEAARAGFGKITKLTNSTTGTANDTVNDVGAAFNQATLNNNFADLTEKINTILTMLQ